jgi:hypothetical protein
LAGTASSVVGRQPQGVWDVGRAGGSLGQDHSITKRQYKRQEPSAHGDLGPCKGQILSWSTRPSHCQIRAERRIICLDAHWIRKPQGPLGAALSLPQPLVPPPYSRLWGRGQRGQVEPHPEDLDLPLPRVRSLQWSQWEL